MKEKQKENKETRTDWARVDTQRDEELDLTDSPEVGPEFFSRAKRKGPGTE
jgi:hypothetical protein